MKKKETIIFDVDNVLLDFSKTFSIWLNKKNTKYPKLSFNPNDYHHGYKNNLEFKNYIAQFILEGVMMPPLEKDIPQIIQKLHKKYNIILLTAYPNMAARKANLKKLNIIYDKLVFAYPNVKPSVIKKMKWDPIAVFEDRPSTIKLLSKAGFLTFVPYRWNYIRNEDWTGHKLIFYNKLTDTLKKFL
jgi:FMN phosphatase YigB (HAD superfamily)